MFVFTCVSCLLEVEVYTMVRQASVAEIKAKLDRGDDFRLIDVREPQEHATAQIAEAELLPMSMHQAWVGSLPKDAELVIFCHHGGRSAQVAAHLEQLGHTNVTNMVGGIDDWSLKVDPAVPRY